MITADPSQINILVVDDEEQFLKSAQLSLETNGYFNNRLVQDPLTVMGILDETIIVFTSDHGNHFKTRNGEYKRSCHESAAR